MTSEEAAGVENCHGGYLYRITARGDQTSPELYVLAASRDVVNRRLPRPSDQNEAVVIEHKGVKISGPFKVTRLCPRHGKCEGVLVVYSPDVHGRICKKVCGVD